MMDFGRDCKYELQIHLGVVDRFAVVRFYPDLLEGQQIKAWLLASALF